jgi:hypothetical protein
MAESIYEQPQSIEEKENKLKLFELLTEIKEELKDQTEIEEKIEEKIESFSIENLQTIVGSSAKQNNIGSPNMGEVPENAFWFTKLAESLAGIGNEKEVIEGAKAVAGMIGILSGSVAVSFLVLASVLASAPFIPIEKTISFALTFATLVPVFTQLSEASKGISVGDLFGMATAFLITVPLLGSVYNSIANNIAFSTPIPLEKLISFVAVITTTSLAFNNMSKQTKGMNLQTLLKVGASLLLLLPLMGLSYSLLSGILETAKPIPLDKFLMFSGSILITSLAFNMIAKQTKGMNLANLIATFALFPTIMALSGMGYVVLSEYLNQSTPIPLDKVLSFGATLILTSLAFGIIAKMSKGVNPANLIANALLFPLVIPLLGHSYVLLSQTLKGVSPIPLDVLLNLTLTMGSMALIAGIIGLISKVVTPVALISGAIALGLINTSLLPVAMAMNILSETKIDASMIPKMLAMASVVGAMAIFAGAIGVLALNPLVLGSLALGGVVILGISGLMHLMVGTIKQINSLSGINFNSVYDTMENISTAMSVIISGLPELNPIKMAKKLAGLKVVKEMGTAISIFTTDLTSIVNKLKDIEFDDGYEKGIENIAFGISVLSNAIPKEGGVLGALQGSALLGAITLTSIGTSVKSFVMSLKSIFDMDLSFLEGIGSTKIAYDLKDSKISLSKKAHPIQNIAKAIAALKKVFPKGGGLFKSLGGDIGKGSDLLKKMGQGVVSFVGSLSTIFGEKNKDTLDKISSNEGNFVGRIKSAIKTLTNAVKGIGGGKIKGIEALGTFSDNIQNFFFSIGEVVNKGFDFEQIKSVSSQINDIFNNLTGDLDVSKIDKKIKFSNVIKALSESLNVLLGGTISTLTLEKTQQISGNMKALISSIATSFTETKVEGVNKLVKLLQNIAPPINKIVNSLEKLSEKENVFEPLNNTIKSLIDKEMLTNLEQAKDSYNSIKDLFESGITAKKIKGFDTLKNQLKKFNNLTKEIRSDFKEELKPKIKELETLGEKMDEIAIILREEGIKIKEMPNVGAGNTEINDQGNAVLINTPETNKKNLKRSAQTAR